MKRIILIVIAMAMIFGIFYIGFVIERKAIEEGYCTVPSHKLNTYEPTEPAPIIIECNHPIEVIVDPSEWFVTDETGSQFGGAMPENEIVEDVEPTEAFEEEELVPTYPPDPVAWYSSYEVGPTDRPTTQIMGEEVDRDFLAKLLYAEAGAMDWWGQVYTCSAILNFCEVEEYTLYKAGHNKNCFSVAPYVDSVKPTDMTYEVIDYVLEGGRIAEICYFRTGGYHTFGTPVCKVGAHYFSK